MRVGGEPPMRYASSAGSATSSTQGPRAGPARASRGRPIRACAPRARSRQQRLLRGEPEQRARHVEHQKQRRRRRRAGIAVGGDRHRHALALERRDGAATAFRAARRTRRAGAPPRSRLLPSRRPPLRLCIRGDRRTEPPTRLRSRRHRLSDSWSACSLDAQSVRARTREHASRLRRREADRFAIGVDRVGERGARRGGDRVVAHVGNVLVRAIPRTPGGTASAASSVVRTVTPSSRRRARARRAAGSAPTAVSRP